MCGFRQSNLDTELGRKRFLANGRFFETPLPYLGKKTYQFDYIPPILKAEYQVQSAQRTFWLDVPRTQRYRAVCPLQFVFFRNR
jgi:hypothetical protein